MASSVEDQKKKFLLLFGSYLGDLMDNRRKTVKRLAKDVGITDLYLGFILEGTMTPSQGRTKRIIKALKLIQEENDLLWTLYWAAETGVLEEEVEFGKEEDIPKENEKQKEIECIGSEPTLVDGNGRYEFISPEEIASFRLEKCQKIPVIRRNQNGDCAYLEDELGDFVYDLKLPENGRPVYFNPPKPETDWIRIVGEKNFRGFRDGKEIIVTISPIQRLLLSGKEVERHRFGHCIFYDACINKAIELCCTSFSCINCHLFGKEEFVNPKYIRSPWITREDYNPFLESKSSEE